MTAWIPDVVTGETIEAVWGNQIRDRTITPFPNAAARDAAIPAPKIGMTVWLTDSKTMSSYDGTAWSTTNVPLAGCIDYYGTDEPPGWKFPNGQALARLAFPALFAKIGTTYGVGDNSTTFNLPDKTGRVSVQKDAAFLSILGTKGGEANHVLTAAELAAHDHGAAGSHVHGFSGYASLIGELMTSTLFMNTGPNVDHPNADVTFSAMEAAGNHAHASVGSNAGHNNMQPFIIVNCLMRVI
jgi:microcystin-dependent protein